MARKTKGPTRVKLAKTSAHHIIPRSRGGKKTIEIPDDIHQAWHRLFENLYGQEAIDFIHGLNRLFQTRQEVTRDDINALRQRCRNAD